MLQQNPPVYSEELELAVTKLLKNQLIDEETINALRVAPTLFSLAAINDFKKGCREREQQVPEHQNMKAASITCPQRDCRMEIQCNVMAILKHYLGHVQKDEAQKENARKQRVDRRNARKNSNFGSSHTISYKKKLFFISPSMLGWYFHYNCNRYLHKGSAVLNPNEDGSVEDLLGHEAFDIHEITRKGSIMASVLDKGFEWEEYLINMIKDNGLESNWFSIPKCTDKNLIQIALERQCAPTMVERNIVDLESEAKAVATCRCNVKLTGHIHGCTCNQAHLEISLDYLRDAPVGTILYQPMFEVLDTFYQTHMNIHNFQADALIKFTRYKPDLILIEKDENNDRIAVIVDAKASKSVKLEHRVQVAFYVLALRSTLEAMASQHSWRTRSGKMKVRISDVAGVWRNGTDKPNVFFVNNMVQTLCNFFKSQLMNEILTHDRYNKGYKVQDWHFSKNCVGCRWFDTCKQEMLETRTLSYIHHIEKEEKEWLEKFVNRKQSILQSSNSHERAITQNVSTHVLQENQRDNNRNSNRNNVDDIEALNTCLFQLKALEDRVANEPITSAEERRQLSATLAISFDHNERFSQHHHFSTTVSISPKLDTLLSPIERRTMINMCRPTGNFSTTLPYEEDWAILLSMPKDLRSDRVYGYCIRAVRNLSSDMPQNLVLKDAIWEPKYSKFNFITNEELNVDPETKSREILFQFVTDFYDIVEEINRENNNPSTCFYVMDYSTKVTIVSSLVDLLESIPENLDAVPLAQRSIERRKFRLTMQSLYILIQRPDDIGLSKPPDMGQYVKGAAKDFLPRFSVIMEEVKRLIAMPIAAFYTPQDCLNCFWPLNDQGIVHERMKYDAKIKACGEQGIYQAWALSHLPQETNSLQRLEVLLDRELRVAVSILHGIRFYLKRRDITGDKPNLLKVYLPKKADALNLDTRVPLTFASIKMSKMSFFNDFEFLAEYREFVQNRTISLTRQITHDHNAILQFIRFDDPNATENYPYEGKEIRVIFKCLCGIDTLEEQGRTFGSNPWMLIHGTDVVDLQSKTIAFTDLPLCNKTYKPYPGRDVEIAFACIENIDLDTAFITIRTEISRFSERLQRQFNVSGLKFPSSHHSSAGLYSIRRRFVSQNAHKVSKYLQEEMQNMHNTQRLSVFWEVVHHPYVWCTNQAFENYNTEFQSIITRIGRTTRTNGTRKEGFIHKQSLRCMKTVFNNNDQIVVGGTVWKFGSYNKATNRPEKFDILFIDEASQLRLPEAAFAINALDKDCGRLVIVGDHWQLAPIILEKYPNETSITEPKVYDSFLVYLRNMIATEIAINHQNSGTGLSNNNNNLSQYTLFMQLNENHRMNAELAWYTENILNYDGYKLCSDHGCVCRFSSNNHNVTSRPSYLIYDTPLPVVVDDNSNNSRLVQILDPKVPFSMVNIIWNGGHADELTNEIGRKLQAKLVSKIVTFYIEHSSAAVRNGEKIFCVTPHHLERKAVLDALNTHEKEHVVVNTVECMQGQEADLVIICYSYFNNDRVIAERDFLYDRHRLIVSLSRAKVKIIFLVTDALINPSFDLFEDEKAEEGYSILNATYHLCIDNDSRSNAYQYVSVSLNLNSDEEVDNSNSGYYGADDVDGIESSNANSFCNSNICDFNTDNNIGGMNNVQNQPMATSLFAGCSQNSNADDEDSIYANSDEDYDKLFEYDGDAESVGRLSLEASDISIENISLSDIVMLHNTPSSSQPAQQESIVTKNNNQRNVNHLNPVDRNDNVFINNVHQRVYSEDSSQSLFTDSLEINDNNNAEKPKDGTFKGKSIDNVQISNVTDDSNICSDHISNSKMPVAQLGNDMNDDIHHRVVDNTNVGLHGIRNNITTNLSGTPGDGSRNIKKKRNTHRRTFMKKQKKHRMHK
eukprot:g1609.t1